MKFSTAIMLGAALVLSGCNASTEGGPGESPPQASGESMRSNDNFPQPWWRIYGNKSASFYRSLEGRQMADNMLTWQNADGGWPLMTTWREPFTGDESRAGPWGRGSALVKSSVNEIRFLARAYAATGDDAYKAAAEAGISFILDHQYENGGWPHAVNDRNEYDQNVGYNDDEMADIIDFLIDVRSDPEFSFLSPDKKARVESSFDSAIQFILDTQILVEGTRTAWAQQYDQTTLQPAAARAFEPAAISGGESAGVLLTLMSVRNPSDDVKAAIEAGVQWYRDAQIDGLRLERGDGDQTVTEDPTAPPLWARYYEIPTMKPIFAGRDGIIRYAMAEIEQERRGGYAWYNYNGSRVFAAYEDWSLQRKWDDQPPPNIDEASVEPYTLPELLVTRAGERVETPEDWEAIRRPEIMTLLETYQQGITPDVDVPMTFDIIEQNASSLDGAATRTQVRIEFPGHEGLSIRVLLMTPADATGPVPTLLRLAFSPNILTVDEPGIDEGMAWSGPLKSRVPDRDAYPLRGFDPMDFISEGYGLAMVYYGDIYPDFDHDNAHGVTQLFDLHGRDENPSEMGAIAAWSWGLSRVMDYLQTDPSVDGDRVAVSGVSRLGKTALWAGAQDERFALVVPLLSGEGGAALSRRNYGETVADLTNPSRYDYWYAPNYQDYAFRVDELPVDGHMLLSMIAPRPVLLLTGSEDTWSDPQGEWASLMEAQNVWELYGREVVPNAELPSMSQLQLFDVGYYMHEGGHTVLPGDTDVIVQFMDKHFKSSDH